MDDQSLNELAARLGQQLTARGWHVTTAESCTGGWVAKCLTDCPGSSAWFDYGFVTYSNTAKQTLLGVSAELLQQHGAVSADCVVAMALGALQRSGADLAVALSGIAGPSGGTPDKPVGMVWIAWAQRDAVPKVQCFSWSGAREQVRRCAVQAALHGLLDGFADLATVAKRPAARA